MEKRETRICVVDTDILIDVLRGYPEALEKVRLAGEKYAIATTAYNIFELYRGTYLKGRHEEMEKVEMLLEPMAKLPLTPSSAKAAASTCATLQRQGNEIEHPDALIAAIALEHDAVMLTENKKHFAKIRGLELI